jgi:mannan endo-1,4-beta-mannosidase
MARAIGSDTGEDEMARFTRWMSVAAVAVLLLTATQCRWPRPGGGTTTTPAPVTTVRPPTTPSTAAPTTAAPTTRPPTTRPSATGAFSIRDGRLYDAKGAELVLRGINHAHTWYQNQTSSFAAIRAAGANSIRVVLAGGGRWPANPASDVANVISLCKQNQLICILENHDTTGYGEQQGAVSLDASADYFISLASVLRGQEAYVIVNIGNEPFGNGDANEARWLPDTTAAIRKLRAAGLRHTLMVDGPAWGQDGKNTMRDNAPAVWSVDQNLIFSVHMYSVYDTAAEITSYLDTFVNRKLPLVIGEFGGPTDQWGDPDEDTMMSHAQSQRIGYLGWSWSGNSDPVLDMVLNFDPDQKSAWGRRFIDGANGLRQTSRPATIW